MNPGIAAENTLALWFDRRGVYVPFPSQMVDGVGLCHARWMLDTIRQEATTWKNDKLNRWLGYAQGLLVVARVLTLEEVKQCNLRA